MTSGTQSEIAKRINNMHKLHFIGKLYITLHFIVIYSASTKGAIIAILKHDIFFKYKLKVQHQQNQTVMKKKHQFNVKMEPQSQGSSS
jgi:hypothetical protein